ncbi:TadA family conjugal transfer-associated ATPase [Glycomyces buryatensis]|uniref:TadA family conjugal transfer-associated ATPase n=1 Tax=Glycomyces buryatensis TaxID=2570927 RepID=A0A4S8QJL0_9ACTN|nr:TadA family conjugal transfer-associated ATPase [Glycomyces buryatensis]THV41579.1 TadA family conjugal transfer-associated ATPase [Glycomyces buryatensis]
MNRELLDRIRRQLAAQTDPAAPGEQRGRTAKADIVRALCESGAAPPDQRGLLDLSAALADDLTGAGALQPLLDDATVTDVVVNGEDGVWIDRGEGLRPAPVALGGTESIRSLACRLAAAAGRRLDAGNPYADVRLPDGTRFHAVLPPIAANGPFLSFRTHRSKAFTLAQLVAADTLTADLADVLLRIVKAKLPFVVTGGTGTGKTTLLASLLSCADDAERIVIVEDAAELAPDHPHTLTLEARPANIEGAGEVDLASLVRQALRMRPDRIVVGECRGAEVSELLAALNTGHEGGAGTLHCNAAADVPARLEALALPHGLPRAGLHAQLVAALRVIIHLRRCGNGRQVAELAVIDTDTSRSGGLTVATAWTRHGPGPAAGILERLLRERNS